MVALPGLVTLGDIEDRFYRELTTDEKRVVPAWIRDAGEEILDLAGYRIAERLEAPEVGLSERVARVIRAAVMRRLQNPQGRRQYSYTVDDATVSETLASETLAGAWFTDEELDRLAPAGYASDAFTIRTDVRTAPVFTTGYPPPPIDEWYPWTLL